MSDHGGVAVQMASEEKGSRVIEPVKSRVKRFVMENFYVSDPSELDDDTSLITTGTVDSTGMLEIIAFLESEYGIKVLDPEMIPANLETLGRIAAFADRKTRDALAASREKGST
jgi:acyl carrier protein